MFDFPVICVGNITVGGTGKTPHVEYLIELLKDRYKIGVLSRGYKRKTKGYILAVPGCDPVSIGDESYQIYKKFSDINVAVCEKRVDGIKSLIKDKSETNVVILDDAFQHRYVNPGLSVLLIDYNRPVFNDFLLPAGNLREPLSGIKRADIIIVTKVGQNSISQDLNKWKRKLKLSSNQKLFFTDFKYSSLTPVFNQTARINSIELLQKEKAEVLVITGIAQPGPFLKYLKDRGLEINVLTFPDHHNFSDYDIEKVKKAFNELKGRKKIILTTEKDAVRLQHLKNYPVKLKEWTYYIPVRVKFLNDVEQDFNNIVFNYVRED